MSNKKDSKETLEVQKKINKARRKFLEFNARLATDDGMVMVGGINRSYLDGRKFEMGEFIVIKANESTVKEAKAILGLNDKDKSNKNGGLVGV